MKKATLSVVLATYNEEKNLPDCLQSIKNLADEIIIVDGQSSDKTTEIAKSFGAKILVVENKQNFHINKQKAIDLATKDWILQLDADERVTPKLGEEMREKICNFEVAGYFIPRKNWFLGRFLMKGGVYPDYTLRLYQKGKGKLPQRDVHEQATVNGKIGYLTQPLIHMADPYIGRYFFRFNRYTDLIAQQLLDKKIKKDLVNMLKYMVVLPLWWFGKIYIRHKGFLDGWQGFIWAFFSANRFFVGYWKYLRMSNV